MYRLAIYYLADVSFRIDRDPGHRSNGVGQPVQPASQPEGNAQHVRPPLIDLSERLQSLINVAEHTSGQAADTRACHIHT